MSSPTVHALAPDALGPLPTGVLTFCMSDIEGSTHLWERDPEAMLDALVRHGERIGEAVEAHGGRLLRWMGEGDSTVSVFTSPADAVAAAIAAATALDEEPSVNGQPIRTRFGLHTGTAEIRDGVYVGTTLNLTARIRNEASGQEILLSEMTATLVQQKLPRGYTIVALGEHRLKGIGRPQPIRALAGPGVRTTPDANTCPYRGLLPFEAADRYLFFGRENAETDVVSRIRAGRLLAVIGPSGSGKSSLLRAGLIATVQAGELPGVTSALLITPSSAAALQRTTRGDDPAALLVVDQFEELYTQCRDPEYRRLFIEALLSRQGPTVIGARADFYGELSGDTRLAAAVARHQVLLGPMGDDDLRRAIAEPANRAGVRLEPGLIDLVLPGRRGRARCPSAHVPRAPRDVGAAGRRTLTVAAYQASGGVSEAIARTADAVAHRTPERDRPVILAQSLPAPHRARRRRRGHATSRPNRRAD